MLSEVFYWVLNMSVVASISGIIILILRKIRKIPSFFIYSLWAVPFLRFWIPFGLAYEYSLMNLISKVTTRTIVVLESIDNLPALTMTNSFMAAQSYHPVVYRTDLLKDIYSVSSVIWAIFFIAGAVSSFMLYCLTKSETKNAVNIRDNIYESDRIKVPSVYGILKPKIIVPSGISERYLQYILKHEKVHIKRNDNLLRTVAVITACLHWFNPLAWIFLRYFFEDMEFACDEKVLKGLNDIKKKEYAHALIGTASRKTVFSSAFCSAKIKVRIERILSYRKLTAVSMMFFILLIAVIIITLITNPAV